MAVLRGLTGLFGNGSDGFRRYIKSPAGRADGMALSDQGPNHDLRSNLKSRS
jgi:hypothetical protein